MLKLFFPGGIPFISNCLLINESTVQHKFSISLLKFKAKLWNLTEVLGFDLILGYLDSDKISAKIMLFKIK